MNIPLDLLLGFGIGLSLGLIGGGGSILTVPTLVYLVGQSPQVAITTSLAIVGANSLAGIHLHQRAHNINLRVALLFGIVGMLAAYLVADFSAQIPPALLLTLFALLMILVAVRMLISSEKAFNPSEKPASLLLILATGLSVGMLTGILGVGGGFVIVPALVMLVGLPMTQAVGTSLVIIALNSLAGFIGHVKYAACDIPILAIFSLGGLLGVLAGTRICHQVSANTLRKVFAAAVLCLAAYLLWDNLPKLLLTL